MLFQMYFVPAIFSTQNGIQVYSNEIKLQKYVLSLTEMINNSPNINKTSYLKKMIGYSCPRF